MNRGNQATTLPRAHISHRTKGRTRLRVVGASERPELFEQIHTTLGALQGVDSVRADFRTGSVLVLHECELDDIEGCARREGLFELGPRELGRSLDEHLEEAVANANEALRQSTNGLLDLSSIATLALAGAGIFQIARGGTVLPAGVTLLWNALGPKVRGLPRRVGR